MIEVKLNISEVDYASAIDLFLHALPDELPGNPVAAAALHQIKKLPSAAARTALKVMPEDTKNALAAACVNHYSDKISKMAVEMAQKRGVPLKVDGVEAAVKK